MCFHDSGVVTKNMEKLKKKISWGCEVVENNTVVKPLNKNFSGWFLSGGTAHQQRLYGKEWETFENCPFLSFFKESVEKGRKKQEEIERERGV